MIVTWFKFIHVAAITLWAGGLLALPFLYHQRKGLEDEALFKLHAFTRHFYVAIISPAAFVAIGSGTVLIFLMSTYENWFSAKLLAVAVMAGIHIFSGLVILRLFEPGHTYPAWRQVVVVTLTAIVITVILTLVLGKPRLDWPDPLAAVFAPGALSKIAEQIIGGAK